MTENASKIEKPPSLGHASMLWRGFIDVLRFPERSRHFLHQEGGLEKPASLSIKVAAIVVALADNQIVSVPTLAPPQTYRV